MQSFRRSRVGCSTSFTTVHSSFTTVHHTFILVQKTGRKKTSEQTSDVMSYDYAPSCRTFIATHVVRHDNLIKTVLRSSCLSFQFLLNVLQMLYDASVHILLVCSIVQLLSIALEVSIETLFDAMKQQYKYSISTYKYRYRTRKQSSPLSSPISCWAIL